MMKDIDALVSSYEHGTLTRRQLLYALAIMAAPVADMAQTASGGLVKGRNLHHVNVRVSDIARSEAFYRNLFGFSPTRRVQGPDNHGFDLPGAGLIILQKSDQPGHIDHFCIGVDDFDAERLRTRVKNAGIEGRAGQRQRQFLRERPRRSASAGVGV